jgi:hypothetical protein
VPLPTIESEVNGDSNSTNERGSSLVGSLDLSCKYKTFLFCLAGASRPSKIFFLSVHYFNSFVLIAQQAVQAAVLGRMSLSMCLWLGPWMTKLRGMAG